jgi:rubrerythrin
MSPRILLHPLAERHARRRRPARRAASIHKREVEPTTSAAQPASTQHLRDIAVERVRASGGPLDQASYSCQCGYLFAAPVSTTVSCPHCGTAQAW